MSLLPDLPLAWLLVDLYLDFDALVFFSIIFLAFPLPFLSLILPLIVKGKSVLGGAGDTEVFLIDFDFTIDSSNIEFYLLVMARVLIVIGGITLGLGPLWGYNNFYSIMTLSSKSFPEFVINKSILLFKSYWSS